MEKVLDTGLRYNSNKVKWSLMHYKSMEPMIRVLEKGAIKYAPDNWKKGLSRKETLESLQRHLAALMDGETHDPETNELHIGHIMCNCMIYSYFLLPENEHLARD
jgi:hypothetical protein